MFENLLIEKYRPATLEDIVLSDKNRKYFEDIRRKQEIPHLMFAGSPGIGKCLDYDEVLAVYVTKETKEKMEKMDLLE